jgi:VWFA-related protein
VDYHLFRATATIVGEETASASIGQGNWLALPAALPAPPPTSVPAEAAAMPATSSTAPAAASTPTATVPAAPPVAAKPPEYTLVPADPIPHVTPRENGFVLKANARLVDVGFVAYDKHGRPVTDLKQDQIEVFDNGKKQQIRLFFQAAPATASLPGAPPPQPTPTDTFTNHVEIAPAAPPFATIAPSSTVLLLDVAHLAWPDLVFARAETIKFLNKLAPSQPVALYTMDNIGFHVLVEMTQNHAMLAAKLQAWTPDAAAVATAQDAEERNTQHFDWVAHGSDLASVNGHRREAPASGGPDPKLIDFGANPGRESLRVLIAVARHLAPLPGHKSLIWVSGDTALVDWSDLAVGAIGPEKMRNKYLDQIADSAGEALNQAHVSVYAVDATAVEAGGIDASLQNRAVKAVQGGGGASGACPPASGACPGGATISAREMSGGRVTRAMMSDLHPIQEPMRRVAESTGGRAVRRASNLGGTLDSILSDTQATYMASFTPNSAPDDTFHNITLKVPGKQGIRLRYRSGYLFAKESSDLKAKFEDAVWRPVDPIEIGLNAKIVSHAPVAKVQLTIAVKDVAFDREGEHWTDKVYVYLVQREEYGGYANSSGETIKFDLEPSTYEKLMSTGFVYQRSLNLQPKVGSLRLIVVDENSGRIGSVTLPAAAFQP